MARKPTKRILTRRNDTLFSNIVRRSKKSCERCGGRNALQAAHIKSRKYRTLRWSYDNILCLDASCHMYFHMNPDLFGLWLEEKFPGRIKKLNKALQNPQKVTIQWLQKINDELSAEVDGSKE